MSESKLNLVDIHDANLFVMQPDTPETMDAPRSQAERNMCLGNGAVCLANFGTESLSNPTTPECADCMMQSNEEQGN